MTANIKGNRDHPLLFVYHKSSRNTLTVICMYIPWRTVVFRDQRSKKECCEGIELRILKSAVSPEFVSANGSTSFDPRKGNRNIPVERDGSYRTPRWCALNCTYPILLNPTLKNHYLLIC